MDTIDIIFSLLKSKGTEQQEFANAIGATKHKVSEWKARKTKSYEKYLNEIATYFNVSTDYLLGNEQKEKPTLNEKDERDISKKLGETLSQLENAQGGLMFDGEPLDDITKELLASSLRKDLEMGKKIAKQKYTPNKYRNK